MKVLTLNLDIVLTLKYSMYENIIFQMKKNTEKDIQQDVHEICMACKLIFNDTIIVSTRIKEVEE